MFTHPCTVRVKQEIEARICSHVKSHYSFLLPTNKPTIDWLKNYKCSITVSHKLEPSKIPCSSLQKFPTTKNHLLSTYYLTICQETIDPTTVHTTYAVRIALPFAGRLY
ncbi:hypothetical protein EUGRSUZ_C00978 [Eucalyptus grandis]|uniref:Uncharacterized protein n=2 Tax=Eucalyptus grandis TaxID=71139 RepID=A0ACC3LCR7_EUCGR|nr:hypothetical protein EUGRSUZ_C00978 [Eucalyptus grandis]